jgi:hypothetical protein
MAKGNTEVLEVLISQMAKDGKIDVVIGKGLSILSYAEFFEPVCNLLHSRTRGSRRGRTRVFDRGDTKCIPKHAGEHVWPTAISATLSGGSNNAWSPADQISPYAHQSRLVANVGIPPLRTPADHPGDSENLPRSGPSAVVWQQFRSTTFGPPRFGSLGSASWHAEALSCPTHVG